MINPDIRLFSIQWSFSTDQLVLDPEQDYLVTVSNLPKPNLGYTGYNIEENVHVPGKHIDHLRT